MTTERKPLNLHRLRAMTEAGEKLVMLTCYDASFARVLDAAGVDVLLVGDSLGMVVQGHASTLPVSGSTNSRTMATTASGSDRSANW